MLTREQLHAFLCMRTRRDTLFSALPKDLFPYMGRASMMNFSQDSDIAKLLRYIAYGDLDPAYHMLQANPRLVLEAGHGETPSGLKVLHTTPLECALGAGDPIMVQMIAQYFEAKEIDGGVAVREKQYARYRQLIADMLNPEKNPPYDFTLLINTLLAAEPEDVTAALKLDMNHDSALRDVLAQFRQDFTPDSINVGMHFNYQHLLHAYEVYEQKYEDLYHYDINGFDKRSLFSCQIIGFIQRSLPAIDRMTFAQGLYDVIDYRAEIQRSFKFKFVSTEFPATGGDSSHSGLGYEYLGGTEGVASWWPAGLKECRTFAALVARKTTDLQNLCGCAEKKIRLDV